MTWYDAGRMQNECQQICFNDNCLLTLIINKQQSDTCVWPWHLMKNPERGIQSLGCSQRLIPPDPNEIALYESKQSTYAMEQELQFMNGSMWKRLCSWCNYEVSEACRLPDICSHNNSLNSKVVIFNGCGHFTCMQQIQNEFNITYHIYRMTQIVTYNR